MIGLKGDSEIPIMVDIKTGINWMMASKPRETFIRLSLLDAHLYVFESLHIMTSKKGDPRRSTGRHGTTATNGRPQ